MNLNLNYSAKKLCDIQCCVMGKCPEITAHVFAKELLGQ